MSSDEGFRELEKLRYEVGEVTREILKLIAKRRQLVSKIADVKKKFNVSVVDRFLESRILSELTSFSESLGLEREFTRRLLSIIISDSVKLQEEKILKTEVIGLREIFYKAIELERSGKKIIRMEVGEPDFPVPDSVVEEVCRALREGKTRYTDFAGIRELREALAKHINDLHGTDLKPSNILITAGGVMAIYIAIQVLSNLGDEVLVPEPAWPLYKQIAEHLGRRYIPVRTK
ncbi:MAG: aminotransferase class I/II-fold pyridoxal phosphate-dependent enzyme, partial [Nitrososphaerota archaeon]